LSISEEALGTLPEDGNVIQKHIKISSGSVARRDLIPALRVKEKDRGLGYAFFFHCS
jgi:hypothetical protein